MWKLMSLESGSVDKGSSGCQYSCPSLVPMPLGLKGDIKEGECSQTRGDKGTSIDIEVTV
jgi:hypothetical protein